MKCEKDRLLEEIGILDFVVVELVLFLDTHPCHQEAMHYFDYYNQMLQEKMREYGCRMMAHATPGDDDKAITAAIKQMIDDGAEMVICTGGMSVDPDDRTPLAIRNSGGRIVSYGAPVLPGAMFLLSYNENGIPVCGLPGCVMYAKRTIFDIVLPYLLADEPVTAELLSGLGNGGLCLNCKVCHYPNCGFGKGA